MTYIRFTNVPIRIVPYVFASSFWVVAREGVDELVAIVDPRKAASARGRPEAIYAKFIVNRVVDRSPELLPFHDAQNGYERRDWLTFTVGQQKHSTKRGESNEERLAADCLR